MIQRALIVSTLKEPLLKPVKNHTQNSKSQYDEGPSDYSSEPWTPKTVQLLKKRIG